MDTRCTTAPSPRGPRCRQRGFGLLEAALLLLIVGGAVVAGLLALKSQQASLAAESELKALTQADFYLQGYVAGHNRLPCPDTVGDGFEHCDGGVQKGRLPYRTLGLEGSMAAAGTGLLAYEVQRSAVDLTTAIANNNLFEPIAWNDASNLYDGHRALGVHGTGDFCQALTNAGAATPSAGQARVGSFASGYPVAYALAHPGPQQAGAGTPGTGFDGLNASSAAEMELPERRGGLGSYDDRVFARTYQGLAQSLDCDRWRTALNSVSLAVSVVEEVESQRAFVTATAAILTVISGVKAIVFAVKIAVSVFNIATAIGYASTAGGLLSAAIASCVVLVGCFEIPHAVASLVAASVAIGASAVSIALNAAALVSSLVAFGITTAAAVAAGNQPGINSVNITQATASALQSKTAATTEASAAAARKVTADNNLVAAAALRDSQWAALLDASHRVVDATNAQNSPNPPKAPATLLARDFLDTEFFAVRTAAEAWKKSQDDQGAAEANLKQANDSAANNNATPSHATSDQIAKLTAQLNATPPPDDQSTPTRKEIQDAIDELNKPTNSGSNADQAVQLQTNIDALTAQVAAIDSQLASTTLAAAARADLVARRAALVDQSAALTKQLASISLTVASATQAKAAAVAAVSSNYATLVAAYNHALDQFKPAQKRLPYTTCVQIPDIPVTNPVTTHEVCSVNYADGLNTNGGDTITPWLYRLFNLDTSYAACTFNPAACHPWIPQFANQSPGSYYDYWRKIGLSTTAQNDLTDAVAKQDNATRSYNALNGMQTSSTPNAPGFNNIWTAPVDALKRIEQTGAIR